MSDYDQSRYNRNFPHTPIDSGGSGTGLLWLLFVVAALGLLVLIGSFGVGSTPVGNPGGTGAEQAITPDDPAANTTGTATVIE
ncbi:hypothetical protein PEL8287_01764 [Roseovarius litorisediminis]|uniref:Uncharacterized protein n=1 Tax=Roseovarius litorisediminis TaxID=1312363 RepID=A0A1Y5SC29_9RHOB|nr:hypothetical protein [Roseovarius litorisediminis]SLN36967.1 hypothetical protein PEL8287_01764 [Roseovarius litorisediminis]